MTRDRILVVGDLINDIVVVPRGDIRPNTDTPSAIRPRPGGAAANTAAWLASLGVPTDFVGAVGSHDAADHENRLRDQGVTTHLQIEYGVPTGTIVILVRDGRRTMLTERGANALLSPDTVTDALLESARLVHLSAYSFLDGFGMPGARALLGRAHDAGALVMVNPGSAGYIEDAGVERVLEVMEGADLVIPNLAEGRALTGEQEPDRIVAALLARFPTVVLTLGEQGSVAASRGSALAWAEAPRVRVVDPTGAGDAFAAGFLQRWLDGADLAAALQAATRVASRAVVTIGGRPAI